MPDCFHSAAAATKRIAAAALIILQPISTGNGTCFLKIPDNYYDDIESKYDLDPNTMMQLRANQILHDREGDGEFFQIYTHAFDDRFFFEIVERRNYRGFGAANAAIRFAAQTREAPPLGMPRIG